MAGFRRARVQVRGLLFDYLVVTLTYAYWWKLLGYKDYGNSYSRVPTYSKLTYYHSVNESHHLALLSRHRRLYLVILFGSMW